MFINRATLTTMKFACTFLKIFCGLLLFTLPSIVKSQSPVINTFTPGSGAPFASISIQGTNFDGATEVSFGGTPASFFFVNSSTLITAYVGNGSSGNVSVTTPFGTSSVPGFTFLPPPIITSFSPSIGGLGTSVTIRGANFTNANFVEFGSVNASSFMVISDSVITAIVGAGSSGNVYVQTANGGGSLAGFTHTGPVINSFSPKAGNSGTSVTITGINFIGTTAITIGGIPVSSFNIVSPTTITAIVAAGSSGTIQVTTPEGIANSPGFNAATITFFTPTQGTNGTLISIKGFNFTGVTSVSFGGVAAASFTGISDTSISAVVASGASGNVNVTTSSYGTASTGFFSYYIPSPGISGFTPSKGGPGTVITIKGKFFSGSTLVSFGSTAAASFNIISDSIITAVVGAGSSGNVSVTNSFGTGTSTGFVFTTLPSIISFSPTSGPVGTQVTIQGINFGTSPGNNTVFFGAVKASITAASNNSLTINVPAGASYTPFILSTNNLTASSSKPFLVTFPGDSAFAPGSFAAPIDTTVGNLPSDVVAGDFDGDGKPDLAVANTEDNTISIYRNTGSKGIISFAAKLNVATIEEGPQKIVTGDINGDGKLDMVLAGRTILEVLINTSSGGNISFAAPYTSFATGGPGVHDISLADLDGDGRVDIVVTNTANFTVLVFYNTTTNGVVSFSSILNNKNLVYDAPNPLSVTTADLDNDGKPEIIVGNLLSASNPSGILLILKNTSTGPGTISFAGSYYTYSPVNFNGLAVTDFDGDLKSDIALIDEINNKVYVLKNTTVGSNITFASIAEFATGVSPSTIEIADLNGDKRPDIVITTPGAGSKGFSVLKNSANNGVISFDSFVNYPVLTGDGPIGLGINDLDLDGKPDIVTTNLFEQKISIYRNKVGPNLNELCPPISSSFLSCDLTGSTYQWEANTGAGFSSITNNVNYSGVNTAALQLNSIPSAWYGYKYRCLVNGNTYSDTLELRFGNTWIGGIDNTWENSANWSCGTIPDANTDVIINSGTVFINSDTVIRSLFLQPGVNVTVKSGKHLTITF